MAIISSDFDSLRSGDFRATRLRLRPNGIHAVACPTGVGGSLGTFALKTDSSSVSLLLHRFPLSQRVLSFLLDCPLMIVEIFDYFSNRLLTAQTTSTCHAKLASHFVGLLFRLTDVYLQSNSLLFIGVTNYIQICKHQ